MTNYILHIMKNGIYRVYANERNRNIIEAMVSRLKFEDPKLDYYIERTEYNI